MVWNSITTTADSSYKTDTNDSYIGIGYDLSYTTNTQIYTKVWETLFISRWSLINLKKVD